eukprot:TRINITY_DN9942_c0_g1_i1.p1 TRINITY_DN9942_c0_g1~~TRINITY_DN9942_c0_g1_i1.p1  ORF type:complete len:2968 (+),score=749.63 TRINITY_DN9942_c0_g1_i1:68-8971(+)
MTSFLKSLFRKEAPDPAPAISEHTPEEHHHIEAVDFLEDDTHLRDVWQKYSRTPSTSPDAQSLLMDLISSFIQRYDGAVSEQAMSITHPPAMVSTIAKNLSLTRSAICEAIITPRQRDHFRFYTNLLHMIAILARFPSNRAALRRGDVQTNIVAILAASTERLKTTARQSLDDPEATQPNVVLQIVLFCSEYLLALLDPRLRWKRLSSADDHRPKDELVVDQPVLTTVVTALQVVLGYPIAPKLQPWHSQLMDVLLNVVGAMVFRSSGLQRDVLREGGCIDIVADLLDPAKHRSAVEPETLDRQYGMHLLSCQLLRVLLIGNQANVRHAELRGVYDRLVDMLLWVSAQFPGVASATAGSPVVAPMVDLGKDLTSRLGAKCVDGRVLAPPKDVIEQLHPQLAVVFQEIQAMCMVRMSGAALHGPADLPLLEPLLRSLARACMRKQSLGSDLKLYVIDLLLRLFPSIPEATGVLFRAVMWEALLSDGFIGVSGRTGARVRSAVMQLLGHALTTCAPSEQSQLVQAMLNNLRICIDPEVIMCLCDTLRDALHCAKTNTQRSLMQTSALQVVTKIVNDHMHWTESVNAAELRARAAELALLDSMLCLPEMQLAALTNAPLMDTLFALIEQREVAEAVLWRVTNLLMESGMRVKEDRKTLYCKYLETLPRTMQEMQRGSEKHFDLLIRLLKSLQSVAKSASKAQQQEALCNAGAWMQVMALLNCEHTFDSARLCETVLYTLSALMAGNPVTRRSFSEQVRPDMLAKLIRRTIKPLTSQFFGFLLDALVEDTFSMDSNYIIRNPEIVRLIFILFEDAPHALQIEIVETFAELCLRCGRNRALCCEARLLERLLTIVPSTQEPDMQMKMLLLIRILGSHDITVVELKSLFRLLTSVEMTLRPPLWLPLLTVLQRMARKTGPRFFFDFDRTNSYITLPTLNQWPTGGGYTFCTWICGEKDSFRQSCLFSLLNPRNEGIEATITNGKIAVQIVVDGKKFEKVFDLVLNEQTWYFIAISHSSSRLLWNESDIFLFVNDETVGKASKLRYPTSLPEPLTNCRLGMSAHPTQQRGSLFGQMGTVHLFSEALTSQQLLALYRLGPDYAYSLQTTDSTDIPDVIKPLVDGGVATKCFVAYNTVTCDGRLALDMTPEHILHGVIQCSTRNVRDIIHCLGGIRVLLPLFAQLEALQPLPPQITDMSFYMADPAHGQQVLSLLLEVLANSRDNFEAMRKFNGFGVISYLLQQLSPRLLSQDTIQLLRQVMTQINSSATKFSCGLPLLGQLFLSLFLDFRLWVYAAPVVQHDLLTMITEQVDANARFFRTYLSFTIQHWLDILRLFYYHVPETISFATNPKVQPVTKDITGQRPAGDDLLELRQAILNIAYLQASDLQPDDLAAVILCLANSQDDLHIVDVLRLMSKIISLKGRVVCEMLRPLGELNVFVSLLENQTHEVRVLSLRCIAQLLALEPEDSRLRGITKYGFEAITNFEFTEPTYQALMQVLLEDTREGVDHTIDLDDEHEFKHPGMLNTIFHLLYTADLFRKQKVLQDFIFYMKSKINRDVKHHESKGADERERGFRNRSAMLRQIGWQNWLLNMLLECKNLSGEDAVVFDLVMTIFKLLLYHALKKEDKGFEVLRDTLGMIELFSRKAELNAEYVIRKIFSDLMETLNDELHQVQSTRESPIRSQSYWIEYFAEHKAVPLLSNLIQMLNIMEDFLFYSPAFQVALPPPLLSPGSTLSSPLVGSAPRSSDSIPKQPISPPLSSTQTPQQPMPIALDSPSPPRAISPPVSGTPNVSSPMSAASLHTSTMAPIVPSVPRHMSIDGSAPDILADNHVTADQVHTVMHRYEDGSWADLPLVELTLKTLDILGFTVVAEFSQMEDMIMQGKLVIVMTDARTGGVPRFVLRLLMATLQEGDTQVCGRNLIRLDLFLRNFLEHSGEKEDNRRSLTVISLLLRAVRDAYARQQAIGGPPTHEQIGKLLLGLLRQARPHLAQVFRANNINLLVTEPDWLRPGAQPRDCVEALLTPEWQLAASIVLDPHSALIEREEAQLAATSATKWRRALRELQRRVLTEQAMQTTECARRRREAGELCATRFSPIETERLKMEVQRYDELTMHAQRTWRTILRSIQGQRGAWGGDDEGELHYMMDKAEDGVRRRQRMKRNYNFDQHAGCAHVRRNHEPEAPEDAAPVAEDITPSLPRIRLSDIVTLQSPKEEILDEETPGSPQMAAQQSPSTAPSDREDLVVQMSCELVLPMLTVQGQFEVTTLALYFKPDQKQTIDDPRKFSALKDRKWPMSEISQIHFRRFQLRRSAIEIFTTAKTNYFFNFKNSNERAEIFLRIKAQRPPNLVYSGVRAPEEQLRQLKLTERWQKRQMSNFDYIMSLNTLAGRTYNDMQQYPVFPWILTDYDSETLDLNDPRIYRDLSKPVGALNEKRLEKLKIRMESFVDPDIPPFLYGSHYSSCAIVLYYMIRVEPFTTLALKLQGGRFDHADRMFFSMPKAYNNILEAPTDFKEMIPEMFYMPELFTNRDKFVFGRRQDGTPMDDVILPRWAKSPEDFIRQHRAALESEYVSEHLHEWLDLIFGSKQRGDEAVTADNLFFHLTYEGSVDVDSIQDPVIRAATISQIDNYGQTPSQLLTKPHPRRNPPVVDPRSLLPTPPAALPSKAWYVAPKGDAVVKVALRDNRLITITENRFLAIHRFSSADQDIVIELESRSDKRRVGGAVAHDVAASADLFAVSRDGKVVFSAGHWDNTCKISMTESTKVVQSLGGHKDSVTCLALAENNQVLVTGSKDATVMVWDVVTIQPPKVAEQPRCVLYGHDDEVTCVCLSTELGVCVSGSKDSTCIIHTLHSGKYLRTIRYPSTPRRRCAVTLVALTTNGHLLMYSRDDQSLRVFSINGEQLWSIETQMLYSLTILNADYIVTGETSAVCIRDIYTLRPCTRLHTEHAVRAVSLDPLTRHVFAGDDDGRLIVHARPSA